MRAGSERLSPPSRGSAPAEIGRPAPADAWAALAVALLALAVYANSLPGIFMLDDALNVRDNPLVTGHEFRTIFLTDYWWSYFTGLYRPLTVASFAANHLLFGPGAFSFHMVNLLLHAGVCALFYLTLRTLVPRHLTAFLAAVLFAVHPVHGEAVNTVVGRAELLAALFVFLGLWADVALPRARRWLCPLCLALAMLSKESGIVLLALLPLADAFRRGSIAGSLRSRWRSCLPLLAVVLAWFLWRRHVLPGDTPLVTPPLVTDNPMLEMPLGSRLLTALGVQLRSLALLAAPVRLQLVYDASDVARIAFPSLAGLAVAAAAALLAGLTVLLWRIRHPAGFALAFCAVAAAPTSNLFVLIAIALAERVAYLPSAGFCLAAAALATSWEARRPEGRAALAVLVAYALALAGLTAARNPDFSHPIRFWERTTAWNPANARAWWYLGAEQGRAGRIAEARNSYLAGTRAEPRFLENWSSLMALSLESEDPAAVLGYGREYYRYAPDVQPETNIMLARAEVLLRRPQMALELLSAVEAFILPERVRSHRQFFETKGIALEDAGRPDLAAECYRKVLEGTTLAEIPIRYARLLLAAGREAEAEEVARGASARFKNRELELLLDVARARQGKGPASPGPSIRQMKSE